MSIPIQTIWCTDFWGREADNRLFWINAEEGTAGVLYVAIFLVGSYNSYVIFYKNRKLRNGVFLFMYFFG